MGSLQTFYWKKGTHESRDVLCPHFNVEIIKMRQYLFNILKHDTPINNTKEMIDHWLYLFKNFTKCVLLFPQNHKFLHFLQLVDKSQLDHHQISIIKKMKQDAI